MKKETRSTLFGIEEIITQEDAKGGFDIWKFVNSISDNKEYSYDNNTKKYYNSWTINKHFSAFLDTFLHVEFLNSNFHLDEKLQHDYLFYSIPVKKKRWKPWLKKSETEKKEAKVLEDVAKTIKYNMRQTKEFWKTLSPQQRKDFLERFVYPDLKNSKKINRG
jgi:hypothetical protein